MGGALDLDAGDGNTTPSALPIVTKNEKLRPAISKIWRWSNWQQQKDIVSLWGAVLGDVGLRVVDDVEREKVYIAPVHPGSIKDVSLDLYGNVKGYVIEEERPDPKNKSGKRMVTYTEIASRDGGNVIYKTLLNNTPYPWDGVNSEWEVPYGFVPFVMVKHNNIGLDFGWSELHPAQVKFREADDIASKLSDQIRKMVDAPWLFIGVDKPKSKSETTGTATSTAKAEPGREEVPAFYSGAGADAKPLVAPLDIAATAGYLKDLVALIEHDYPELTLDLRNQTGDISGRALRLNRQPTENKVAQRRSGYDDAMVKLNQMAVAIGGYRQYDEAFSGFDLTSYDKGALDHSIGDRPVFAKDPLDDLEVEKMFWEVANGAKSAGLPLVIYLERQGWTKEQINQLVASSEYQAREASLKMAVDAATAASENAGNSNPYDWLKNRNKKKADANGEQDSEESES
jgi:hypothetical protein